MGEEGGRRGEEERKGEEERERGEWRWRGGRGGERMGEITKTFMSMLVVTKFTDDLLVREIHLGMVSVDANGGCCLAVDVCSIRLLTLQRHPANGSAA